MPFQDNLRRLMEQNGESGYKLSKTLLCSQSTVSNWLKGKNVPHRSMATAVAAHYGISVAELIE